MAEVEVPLSVIVLEHSAQVEKVGFLLQAGVNADKCRYRSVHLCRVRVVALTLLFVRRQWRFCEDGGLPEKCNLETERSSEPLYDIQVPLVPFNRLASKLLVHESRSALVPFSRARDQVCESSETRALDSCLDGCAKEALTTSQDIKFGDTVASFWGQPACPACKEEKTSLTPS